jgi:predicted small lipoprotein YifL
MSRWFSVISLTGLIVLLAGCGTSTPSVTPPAVVTTANVQLITTAEAYALVESGEGVLYDTRSLEEYRAQHAAGAISLPEADIAARYGELPTDKALIFY